MMALIKKLFKINLLEEKVARLNEIVATQEELLAIEKQQKREYKHYTNLRIPSGDAMQSFLSGLGKQEVFLFYLKTLEDEAVVKFRDTCDPMVTKGALRIISKIQSDIDFAQIAESKKNHAKV